MKVVILDVRKAPLDSLGRNIDTHEDGIPGALTAINEADVLVEVWEDGVYVKRGVEHNVVALISTKSEPQMSMEKALREKDHRVGDKPNDDLQKGDHPLAKMNRIWDKGDPDYVESGGPSKDAIKGW